MTTPDTTIAPILLSERERERYEAYLPWACEFCGKRYAEYVNGCPNCSSGDAGDSHSVQHEPFTVNRSLPVQPERETGNRWWYRGVLYSSTEKLRAALLSEAREKHDGRRDVVRRATDRDMTEPMDMPPEQIVLGQIDSRVTKAGPGLGENPEEWGIRIEVLS